jgi:glycosyltransferase involved in cell wall biosynthesis
MHVAIDASSWENERGFGRFTRSLVAALAARDSGIRYSLLFDQAPERPVPGNVRVVVAGAGQSLSQASSGKGARRGGDLLALSWAARRLECDVFYYPAVYSYFPQFARRPSVVCFHDTIPERFPDLIFPSRMNFRLWQAKTWLSKHQATRVMTVSETSADDLTDILNIKRSKIDVVTEGADPMFHPLSDAGQLAACRKQHAIPPKARLLVYVGGFNRHKNVLRLIEAMPAILDKVPDAHLAIVGRTIGARFWDNVDELKAGAADDVRASKKILFTGEIDDSDLVVLLNTADALVFPSLWEGFGLPAVEAMACATPVLASDRGSLPEVVGDGGLFFDPTSSQDLAEKTIAFLCDDELQARLSRQALRQSQSFGWERAAAMAEDCFRKAAQDR